MFLGCKNYSVYNNMPPLHDLLPSTDFMLFKADIRPEWEAPSNLDGGKWVLTLEIKDQEGLNMQEIWENMMLPLIGCTISHYSHVNGVVMSYRERYFRFSMWTREAKNKEIQLAIGKQFKELTKVPTRIQLVYQIHANAINRQLDNDYIMAV